tara:strand:+ start:286 stop:546 length:261 start_codon:yes stop_codon:yes gene_type:complete
MYTSAHNKRMIKLETIATLIHDNLTNVLIVFIANKMGVALSLSFSLWAFAQILNVALSYIRRCFFVSNSINIDIYSLYLLSFFKRF